VLHKPRKGDGKIPSYPGHGGLSSGEVTPMAVTAKVAKAPLPRLKRLGYEVEEVEEITAGLQTSCPTRFCGGA